MKRINQQQYQRLAWLAKNVSDDLSIGVQSRTIWRGDMRAIQWALWWIRETIEDAEGERLK